MPSVKYGSTPTPILKAPKAMMKVGSICRSRGGGRRIVETPLIRLSGAWLERAGFQTGDLFRVGVKAGQITLTSRECAPPDLQTPDEHPAVIAEP